MIAYKVFRERGGYLIGYVMDQVYLIGVQHIRHEGWGPYAAFCDDVCARKWVMDDLNEWDHVTRTMKMNTVGRFPFTIANTFRLFKVEGTRSTSDKLWTPNQSAIRPDNGRGVVYLDDFMILEEIVDP